MPEKIKEILDSQNGEFLTDELENTDEYTTYKILTKRGNNFTLKVDKKTGKYDLN